MLALPPFVARIRSPIPIVAEGIRVLYAHHPVLALENQFSDFHVSVEYEHRLTKSKCIFKVDGFAPFTPLAANEAYALLEWGLNWCVTTFCHKWLAIHSAVLERDGRALIMPAPPGSGKSTLCAALALNGWRLLSDEMALLDPATGTLNPAPRPVSLKNESIDIIRQREPAAVFGPVAHDTKKGNVAHMRAPTSSLLRAGELSLPAWVVFPQFVANAPATLDQRGKAMSLMQLAENCFNQSTHGKRGFDALAALIERCDCYNFAYGNLDEALTKFSALEIPA